MVQLKCGGCGESKHKIYGKNSENTSGWSALKVKCVKCKSITFIKIRQPAITLEWGPNSTGRLTNFKEES